MAIVAGKGQVTIRDGTLRRDYVAVHSPITDSTQRESEFSIVLAAAQKWNRYSPRAKGWVPRMLGRLFRSQLRAAIRTRRNAVLVVAPESLDVYAHMLNHGRVWNEHVFSTCFSLMHKGGVFYDVGANVGYLSIEMAQCFHDAVTVISFEPQADLCKAIAASADRNGFKNVRAFDLMISDKEQETELFLASHSIHASGVAREVASLVVRRRATTLDNLVDIGTIPPPNVIKLDIEGGELAAIVGATKTIGSYAPTIVLESDDNMKRWGYSRRDLLEALGCIRRYAFFFIDPADGTLIPVGEQNLNAGFSDVLAKPR